ncbi:nitrite/sulfite reductase [Oceanospirillaceae bacterium]|jgi:sulfite reductase (NADPH) hemoprotein beta-component|nr:nitrite/sulfite reductase [Oceanospirillaceae bacterium]MDC1341241.1 nitrite/sulfite reductase [Oceanospirillaceae bacterium]|tara:strand:- start:1131 stop:2801 length:1671 start_codon:yes stop_codon:yes gene_type:complete
MYAYNQFDQTLVDQRVEQYRDQTRRYLAGKIPEDEFRILRLMNGLYIQRHAPMLRVAVPYGLMKSEQLRALAQISRTYDKGYGHFTTRQNMQFNWPTLESVPDILADLAKVQMHAIQTSGACIRNTTTDPFAGATADEIEDTRPWCEIIRQWSTLHPEFAYLPRKFKIAVSGSDSDRAASQVHDIGLHLYRNDAGQMGFEVIVGGGLGRTPVIGKTVRKFLEPQELLSYLDAVLRVYNLNGRRDNKYKARIKILVNAVGIEAFTKMVEEEWQFTKGKDLRLPQAEIERVKGFFKAPDYLSVEHAQSSLETEFIAHPAFATWHKQNTRDHKQPGYRIVVVSLKNQLQAPGDISHQQMDGIAALADEFSFGELRSTHDQNLVLADIAQRDLFNLWLKLTDLGMGRANIGTLTDMINCPGLDFCSLANAETLILSRQINETFDDMNYQYDLGEIQLKISGCINACGHHHVGHIGILGVEKGGKQVYQFTLGGSASNDASLGKTLGRSIDQDQVVVVIGQILDVYVQQRETDETFLQTVQRIGFAPFKERVYGTHQRSAA